MRKREQKRPFSPLAPWVIILLIWAIFGLYLYKLDSQSLWRDEILSIGRAKQTLPQIFSNINIVTGVISPDLHPPFYFLLLNMWQQAIGVTEFAYRYFSVLMGVLALPLFYACGNRIWGRSSGVWTAVFAGLSPFYLWYAQETRMYALLIVETLLVIYTLWPLLFPVPKKKSFAYFGLAMALALYTHYSGVYLLGFSLGAIVFSQLFHTRFQTRITWKFITFTGVVLILLLLLTLPLWPNLRELLTARGFIAFSRPSPWWLLLTGLNTFTQGSANPPALPVWQMLPFLLLAGVGALSLDVYPRERRLRAILISLGGLIGALALFYAVSFVQANYSNPRHLMVISPFLFLLLGNGIVTLYRHVKVAAVLVGGFAVVLLVFSLYQTVTAPPVVRDDVRSLAAFIEERAKPGDTVIWHNAVMSMVYDYYDPGLETAVLPRYGQGDPTEVLDELAAWQENSQRIWFVGHPRPPFFDETLIPDALKEDWVTIDGVGFPASWAILSASLFQPLQEVSSLPEETLPANLINDTYLLKGLSITPTSTEENGTWATLYWQLDGSADDEPQKACIQLSEPEGMIWSESCTFLRLPTNPPKSDNNLLAHDVWLDLPAGLAPMPYEVTLIMDDQTETIGLFTPERPLSPTIRPPIIEYENGLNLVDVMWLDDTFHTGSWVLGDLVWQATQTPNENLVVQARLVDWLGRPLSEEEIGVAPSLFPEAEWLPGDLVRTRLAMPIPYRMNGRYRLQIALTDKDGTGIDTKSWVPNSAWTTLDTINIEDWPLVDSVPADSKILTDDVVLGDTLISLEAYELERDGENLHVTLHWRSLAEPTHNYATFIHVGQEGEPPIAQGGGPDWERPTQSWRTDEIVSQTFTVVLSEDLADNSTVIQIGMYDLDNPDTRLPLQVNGQGTLNNAYILGTVP